MKMSWETLLVGNVVFKEDKSYDEVKHVVKLLCEYSECNVPKELKPFDKYIKNYNNKKNGAHLTINDNNVIELHIVDVNWSSHMSEEKMNALKCITAKYKDLITMSAFSLFYLSEPDDQFYYAAGEQDEEDVIEDFKNCELSD